MTQPDTQLSTPIDTHTQAPIQRVALRNPKLKEEDLGEWVGTGKKRTYTHIAWVGKVKEMWKELNDPSGHLLDDIRSNKWKMNTKAKCSLKRSG